MFLALAGSARYISGEFPDIGWCGALAQTARIRDEPRIE
jgi:hypothetical protein